MLTSLQMVPERETQHEKSSLIQDMANILSQWKEFDLRHPCEDCFTDIAPAYENVIDSLNHESQVEEKSSPPPSQRYNTSRSSLRDGSVRSDVQQDSFQYQLIPESEFVLVLNSRSRKNQRSSYNRCLGHSGLDLNRKLEIDNASSIDRCAEFDVFLDGL